MGDRAIDLPDPAVEARRTLGETVYEAAVEEGRSLALDEAVVLALSSTPAPAVAPGRAGS
jgi:hypothetical protein